MAALCGALAASLAAMALQYTVGKKAFAEHDSEIREALARRGRVLAHCCFIRRAPVGRKSAAALG